MQLGSISATATGSQIRSSARVVDDFQAPFNIGVGAKITSGTPTFNIEYSFDDPNASGYTVSGATWYIAAGFSGLTASTGGAIIIPCRAICINITSGTGAVTASIVQAGPA
jgi:hypothetical protein